MIFVLWRSLMCGSAYKAHYLQSPLQLLSHLPSPWIQNVRKVASPWLRLWRPGGGGKSCTPPSSLCHTCAQFQNTSTLGFASYLKTEYCNQHDCNFFFYASIGWVLLLGTCAFSCHARSFSSYSGKWSLRQKAVAVKAKRGSSSCKCGWMWG